MHSVKSCGIFQNDLCQKGRQVPAIFNSAKNRSISVVLDEEYWLFVTGAGKMSDMSGDASSTSHFCSWINATSFTKPSLHFSTPCLWVCDPHATSFLPKGNSGEIYEGHEKEEGWQNDATMPPPCNALLHRRQCAEWSSWIQHRKFKYSLCCLIDFFLFVQLVLSKVSRILQITLWNTAVPPCRPPDQTAIPHSLMSLLTPLNGLSPWETTFESNRCSLK